MEREYKIAVAIQHYILGEASEAEKEQVEEWLAANERHILLMEKFSSGNYLTKQLPEYEVFHIHRAYERFRQHKRSLVRRRLIYRWSSVAAILFILFGLFFFIKQQRADIHDNTSEMAEIFRPGCSKAILILEGGEQVFLEDSIRFEFVQQMAKIKVSGEQIHYLEDKKHIDSIIPSTNTIITSKGGEYKLILADGTKIWLNADSRIDFPVKFTGNQREVKVKGEVYFEVAKDSLHPFIVNTEKAKVRVLGTSFNIRAYPDEIYRTTLIKGSVEIVYQGEVVKLKPNEQWILTKDAGQIVPANPRVVCSWINGSFAFEEELLPNVFQELERWYDVHVFFANEHIKKLKFTGIFPRYGNMDRVLNIIELAADVNCQINGRTIVIGANENKPGK